MENSYSLLVVDDEKNARRYVLDEINWHSIGVNSLFEAPDGFEALGIVKRYCPDVIILDIRMPGMSGVEFVKRIEDAGMASKIIVLSGYSDFEVARKMVSAGSVVDYILKPASEDILIEAVVKCISEIEEQRRNAELQGDIIQYRRNLCRAAIANAVFGGEDDEDAEPLSPGCEKQIGVCASVYGRKELRHRLEQLAMSDGSQLKYSFDSPGTRNLVLYFEGAPIDEQAVTELCETLLGSGVNIGLGRIYTGAEDLSISYQEAMIACEASLFQKKPKVSLIGEIAPEQTPELGEYVSRLSDCRAANDSAGIEHALEAFIKSLMQDVLEDIRATGRPKVSVQRLAILKARTTELLQQVLGDTGENVNFTSILLATEPYEVYTAALSILHEDILPGADSGDGGQTVMLLKRVKRYISDNYAEKLSLSAIAGKVYVNPSYLSRIFSENEGCVLTEYITRVRIKRAKELLKRRSLKVYEVAEQVGYSNAKYFIKVFKEREGVTPAGYRNKHLLD